MLHLSATLTVLFISILRAPLAATAFSQSSSWSSTHATFQFENGTWLENIAVRPNGNLLVTLLDRPDLYQIDPFHNTAELITTLGDEADALSLLGITEMAHDVFVIIAGNFSIARGASIPASYSVWQVEFNRGGSCEKISKIEQLPEASFLNGMTALNRKEGTVLMSDSVLGVVWLLDTRTGKFEVVLEDTTMKPLGGTPIVLGINGIRIFETYLYYVNSLKGLFCRVPIKLTTGKASGPYEIIATGISGDDFAVSGDEVAFITENGQNSLVRVGSNGGQSLFAEGLNSTLIAGATGAAFGRTWLDKDVIYVTTAGGRAAPVNGTFIEGGKIVAIRV